MVYINYIYYYIFLLFNHFGFLGLILFTVSNFLVALSIFDINLLSYLCRPKSIPLLPVAEFLIVLFVRNVEFFFITLLVTLLINSIFFMVLFSISSAFVCPFF